MYDSVTLCVLLWAVNGCIRDMTEYEDEVLAMIPEHGGLVLNRLRNTAVDDGPSEVHVVEFPSQRALDEYLNDRDRCVARTEVIRVEPI